MCDCQYEWFIRHRYATIICFIEEFGIELDRETQTDRRLPAAWPSPDRYLHASIRGLYGRLPLFPMVGKALLILLGYLIEHRLDS